MTPQEFIDALSVHFPPRHDDDDTSVRWLKHITEGLRGYDPKAVLDASNEIIRTRKMRSFPLLSECREAISRHVSAQPKSPEKTYRGWSKADIAKADKLMDSDVGRHASDQGWSLSLHDFCRTHGRLPLAAEITRLTIQAREFDEAYALSSRGEAGVCSRALERLGNAMLSKRQRYANMAYGEVFEDMQPCASVRGGLSHD